MLGAILGGVGAIFSAIGGIAKGYFDHKVAKVQAQRDVELSEISAGVEVQAGSWKDEWLTVLWTVPFAMNVLGYPEPMNRVIAVIGAELYAGLLMTITAASFGIRGWQDWKRGKLERELTWDRHEKNGNGNGHKYEEVVTPPVIKDPYEAVRPGPLPTDG